MDKSKKSAPILVQLTIFASILIVSSVLSSFFPKAFSVPAAVIGTILLYGLLTLKVISINLLRNIN
ncbi:hypothetical protein [Lactobacillus delbrueckii]|uniref:hypothetical protein n=1 Tax=Lactobacillus delbrueckii TaxID=1584 RepID=UPI0023E3A62C|nr:hypothetical protein [Lactobacillus delbrueckii]MDF4030455.1 hypothetical protein [Lactobacillus delbrueckii]